jgi:hypothetical protein
VRPDPRFLKQPMNFWACVRTISQGCGYTDRGESQIKVPTLAEVQAEFLDLGLKIDSITEPSGLTTFGKTLFDYFQYRAKALNEYVEPLLMEAKQAKALFKSLKAKFRPKCPLPMNKQTGTKKAPACLTGIVNMLIEANAEGLSCDYDPRKLTTVTRDGAPLRTLARRVDGAFPNTVNPIAVWELKEYYYTTTFGSRVADGVYESLLDGMELEELREHEKVDVKHYLMVDAHYTWWDCGRSYLCRIMDMLHMGHVDEVLFGREVVTRLPDLVKEWVKLARSRPSGTAHSQTP